jgi:hypothetical protein
LAGAVDALKIAGASHHAWGARLPCSDRRQYAAAVAVADLPDFGAITLAAAGLPVLIQ